MKSEVFFLPCSSDSITSVIPQISEEAVIVKKLQYCTMSFITVAKNLNFFFKWAMSCFAAFVLSLVCGLAKNEL